MKPPRPKTLGFLALASFLAALGLGWWLAQRTPRAESFAGETTLRKEAPEAQSGKSSPSRLAELERELILACHPKLAVYSRERLLKILEAGSSSEAQDYAKRWARADPSGLFRWFQSCGTFDLPMGPISSVRFTGCLFQEWAQSDPKAALEAAAGITSSDERRDALGVVINELSGKDPDLAAAFLAKHKDGLWSGSLQPKNAEDCRRKWAMLSKIPPGPNRGRLVGDYFRGVAQTLRAEAEKIWAEASPELRRELLEHGLGQNRGRVEIGDPFDGRSNIVHLDGISDNMLSSTDGVAPEARSPELPRQIREHVEAKGDPELAKRYLEYFGDEWLRQNPGAALAWAVKHLSGDTKLWKTGEFYRQYAQRDFAAARAAWETLPPGRMKEGILSSMIGVSGHEEEMRQMLKQLPPKSAAAIGASREEKANLRELLKQFRPAPSEAATGTLGF